MEYKYYKWNSSDFCKTIIENEFKSVFAKINKNTVVVLVDNFEEMLSLFGGGRAMWAICRELQYWNHFILNHKRKQFVYIDFSKREYSSSSMFAFTYDPLEGKFTDSASIENNELNGNYEIRFVLEKILGLSIKDDVLNLIQ
jgi:hypothetical protein